MDGYNAGTAYGSFDLDVSGLNKGVSDAKQSLDSLNQTTAKAAMTNEQYALTLRETVAQAYTAIAKGADAAKIAQEVYNTLLEAGQAKAQTYADAVTAAQEKQQSASDKVAKLQEKLTKAQEDSAKALEHYNQLQQSGTATQEELSKASEKYQNSLKSVERLQERVSKAQEQHEKAIQRVAAAEDAYAKANDNASKQATKYAEKIAKASETAAKAQMDANAKVEVARAQSEAKQLATLAQQETAELKIIQDGEIRKEQIRQKSADNRYKTDQDAIERMISKEEEGVRRSADRRYKAEQDAAAKIEKAKIDAEQKAAQAADKLAQDSADKRYKTDVDAATKLTIAREKLAQQAAQKEAEARQRELDKANRQAEKDAEDSAKKISDSQVAAYSVINRAVNDTIDLVKKLAKEMLDLGEKIVQVGSDFEQSMAQVAATSGMSASEVANNISDYADLVKAARTAGEQTMFTATQAGEALNYLALAGYSVEESIQTMPDILTIAAAGAMDLGRASDMVTDAINALGVGIDRTGEFIDKMAKTAQSSNTNVEQLGNAILTVGGTATVLKDGITELDTALGLMANSGIKARQGGTALRQLLLNLTAPAKKGADEIERLGLEVFDAEGNMRSLQDIFSDLNGIMADFTDQERMQSMRAIFDARYIRAANTLMEQSGDAWTELQAKIEDADGAAEKMADTMMSTFKGAIITAKSTLESIGITIWEGLRKNLTEAVEEAIPKLRELNKVLSSPEVQASLQHLSEELKEIALKLLDKLIEAAPKIIDALANVKTNIESLAIALGTLTAFKIAMDMPKIIAAVEALVACLNPLTIALAAVSATVIVVKQEMAKAELEIEQYIAAFKEQNDVYREQRGEIEAVVEQYKNYKESAEQAKQETEAHVSVIQTLYNKYKDLSAAGEDTTLALQALAEEIPEVSQLIDEGKTSYDDITKAVNDYTDALIREAKVEAAKEGYKEALIAQTKLEKSYHGMEEAAKESQKALDDWDERWKYFKEKSEEHGYWDDFETWTEDELAEWDEMQREEVRGRREALVQINDANAQARDEAKEQLDLATADVQEFEDNLSQIVINGIDERTPDPEDTTSYIGINSKYFKKAQAKVLQELNDFWAEYEKISREVDIGEKSESEKWDLVRLYFTEHPDWVMLDEEFVKLIKQLRSYDDKIAEEEKNEAEKRAKAQQDAADKAKKAREDADKKWQSSVKDAWTDTKWNASYLDYTDKQIADMGRKFLDEQKKFYDSHTDQKDDFIKEIAALDKKWVEDEKTTIDEIEKELPRLKEFYGEDSVIYKSILNIVDQKKLTDNKKAAEKWFKSWTDGYENLVKEAQDAYKELEKKQENFGKKFLDESDLLTKKTKKTWDMVSSSWKEETVEEFDPKKYDDTYKQIQELKKITDELRAKKLDEDTIAQLWDMDPEKALETAKQMNKYSASALADYSKKKEEVQKEIAAEAQKFYEQEAKDFQTQYMDPLQKYVTEGATKIKENMDLIGKDTVQGYIDGMVDKYDATKGAAEKIGADSIEALKKELGIASPSKEFYEIGEWSIQGFLDGLKSKVGEVATMFVTMGQTAGDHFINAFKSTWDNFVTLLNSTGGLQVPVAMTTTAFGMPVSQGAQVTYTGTGTSIYGLTKDDVVSAIKEAVPDGDVILKVGESEFAKISRSSLNNLALQEGSMGLSV